MLRMKGYPIMFSSFAANSLLSAYSISTIML